MTPSGNSKRPTDAELNILAVLWERGSATVREVHEDLARSQDIGQTTVLKLMQIMVEKGLLTRDTAVRPQVYQPTKPRNQTQRVLLRHVVDRAFGGSSRDLVLQALSMRRTSAEELRDIRALLDELEEKEGES